MKRCLPFSVLLFTATGLFAQITVTNATFPAAGDTLKMAIDNSPASVVAITPPGGSQTWDFSGLQVDATQNTIFRPASVGSVGAQVPGADLFTAPSPNSEEYYNVTNNKFELQAYYGPEPLGIGPIALFDYNPRLVERRSPVNFFDINQTTSAQFEAFPQGAFPPAFIAALPVTPDSLRYRISISRTDVVDAWGSLTIPGGTYNVLREKRTQYRESRMDAKVPPIGWFDITDAVIAINPGQYDLGVDTVTSYYFHSDVAKEPIAIVRLNNEQSFAQQVMFKNTALINGVDGENMTKPVVSISPNPFGEAASFGFKNLAPGKYRLVIFDGLGGAALEKTLQVSGAQQERINLSRLPVGMYFFCLFDENNVALYKERLVKN